MFKKYQLFFFTLILYTLSPLSYAEKAKLLIVDSQETDPYKTVRESMLAELPKLGYTPDKNLAIRYYSIGNVVGQAKRIWHKEKDAGYPVIFVNGTMAVSAFKDLAFGTEQAFVFAAVTDPVGVGVIENFTSAPKSNFTGVCYPVPVKARFNLIQQVMPKAKTIGLIYADMPQSHSYRKWIEDLLNNDPAFTDMQVIFRQVPFVKTEQGYKRMVQAAQKHVQALDSQVDVFLSPNDQMGVQKDFAEMLYATASKPLVGLGKKDVMEGWGATMTLYPSQESAGRQVAVMLKKLLDGGKVNELVPEWPAQSGVAFDLKKAAQFGLDIPAELLAKAGADVVR
jgi:putative ABC transport system substrate-binding protein